MDSIGVIGLGIIGRIWARHYEAAGVLAGVWNRSPQPGFPRWQPTPGAVAQAARASAHRHRWNRGYSVP